MKHRRQIQWMVTMAGLALLALPGCSSKWFSSGGDSEFLENGRSADASGSTGAASDPSGLFGKGQQDGIPSLSAQANSAGSSEDGSLRGFDRLAPGQTPSEERVNQGSIASRMMASDVMDKRMAELRREEEAAIAAGFKDAFFGYDRASIGEETRDALSSDAEWIKNHPKAQVKVSGHCDERGTQDYNLVLGDKRAKAVKRYLVDLGVNPQQVSTISFGKNRPFCAEHDESCHRQNRRGHFLLSDK